MAQNRRRLRLNYVEGGENNLLEEARVRRTQPSFSRLIMEHKDLIVRGNTLQLKFVVTNYNNTPCPVKNSVEYVIGGATVFQARAIASQIINGDTNTYVNQVFVRFFKKRPDDDALNYVIKFTCNEFSIIDKRFFSDEGTWHLVHENRKQQYFFDVSLTMDVILTVNSFAPLHEDEELTDFELRGEDGAIRIHKAVLAASSPVFRRMLCGTWKESTEGHVDVPGTSMSTLQHFKNFVYLRTLPEQGLEQLLLLASYYMMPEMEQECLDRLVDSLTVQNACDLLEFSAKNKVTRLLIVILESIQNGDVQVAEIRKHAYSTK